MSITVNKMGNLDVSSNIRMLLAGHESVSMARVYLTAPNVLVASAGAPSVPLAVAGAKSVTITGEDDLFAVKKALEGTAEEREQRLGFPVDTLVIDSLDEFQRLMLVKRLEKERRTDTVSEDWSWISNRLNRIFTGLTSLDLNIVVISHLANVHESTAIKPNIQGAFANQIHKYVDYALLLDAYEVINEPAEVVVDSSTDTIDISYDTSVKRSLVTVPTPDAPWVHDDTQTLDRFIDLTFEDDFATIVERRLSLVLPESDTIVIEDPIEEVPEPVEEKTEEAVTKLEPVVEATPAPGMSSHDAIKAKLLGKS